MLREEQDVDEEEYVCPHTRIVSSHYSICVLMLRKSSFASPEEEEEEYMCPYTMCPHTTISVAGGDAGAATQQQEEGEEDEAEEDEVCVCVCVCVCV